MDSENNQRFAGFPTAITTGGIEPFSKDLNSDRSPHSPLIWLASKSPLFSFEASLFL